MSPCLGLQYCSVSCNSEAVISYYYYYKVNNEKYSKGGFDLDHVTSDHFIKCNVYIGEITVRE